MRKIEIGVILGLLGLCAIIIYVFNTYGYYAQGLKDYTYKIETNWELPAVLKEISGMVWIKDSTMAAIEDEEGLIYTYSLSKMKVVDTVRFAGPGDYESLAINNEDAYIMRSDGLLFEVLNYKDSILKKTNTYKTFFTEKHNMEAMTFDKVNNRLLVIPKDRDPFDKSRKGIYAFSLKTKTMSKKPILVIDMEDESFAEAKRKKLQKVFRASGMAIHPITNEFYIIEGTNPKLIILSREGKFKRLQLLNPDDFQQPESVAFSEDGKLFISNEAHSESANILEVILNDLDVDQKVPTTPN